MNPGTPRNARWPAERFYWALLDTSLLPRQLRGNRRRLDYLLEAQLPVPIDQVHAVYRRLPGRRCLAAAVDREQLRSAPEGALTLAPEALPEFIDAPVRPEAINFLSGPFEPAAATTLRRQRWTAVLALLALCAAAAVLGMERRGRQAREESLRARQETTAALQRVLGESGGAGAGAAGDVSRARLRVRGQLEELRRTRPANLPGGELDRADLTLGALLAAWPRDLEARVETATITGSVVAISGEVPSTADAQRLMRALEAVEGWRPQQPEVETLREGAVRIGLRLVRNAVEASP